MNYPPLPSTGVPPLPDHFDTTPVPPTGGRALFCLTVHETMGWRMVNSLFELVDHKDEAPQLDFWFWTPEHPVETPLITGLPAYNWPRLVQAVTGHPNVAKAVERAYAWTVFGKSNLVDPLFHWAGQAGMFGMRPSTSDVIEERFGRIFPTSENRSGFTRALCQRLSSTPVQTPIDFLRC